MMQRSLREAHERGQVLASLRASEAPIYGRFGYGLAGDYVSVHIVSARTRPLRGARATGSMRLLRLDEVMDVVPPLYDRVARRWVGTIDRPAWMWNRYIKGATEPASAPFGKGEFVAVHSSATGVDDGYIHYETELVGGLHDAVHRHRHGPRPVRRDRRRRAARCGSTCSTSTSITAWQAEERPVSDPIRRSLHDVRAYETRAIVDEQWVRLLDVDAALSARTYGPCASTVTIAVTDPLIESNNDRWAISGAGAQRTSDPADIIVDIAKLSTAYMGGVAWRDIAASGLLPLDVDPSVLGDPRLALRPPPDGLLRLVLLNRQRHGPEKMPSVTESVRERYSTFGS